jgi:CheY-like chemotaxis protein
MDARLIEDDLAIRSAFLRLAESGGRPLLAFRQNREALPLVDLEEASLCLAMGRAEYEAWQLAPGEKVSLNLEDRGFKYEAIGVCQGFDPGGDLAGVRVSLPRTLRRTDGHRLADFAPEAPLATIVSSPRNTLLDGVVRGLGRDGVELSLRDPRQRVADHFKTGDESMLDLLLGEGLRLVAPTRVAYLDDRVVGMHFTERADQSLLGQYRAWLEGQQKAQAQRDRESLQDGCGRLLARRTQAPALPAPRLLVDRDPLVLLLTEQEDFAQRMAEGLGRKFGFLALDHIKGPLRPQVAAWAGAEGPAWGRLRLVLVHNRLRLASPLELTRQLVEEERCPLPILVAGTDEDLDLKRNRALAAGAVGYLPVDPFRILAVLKSLDDTLRLFEH